MIEQLNETVKKIEALDLSLPYLSLTIDKAGPTLHVSTETFDKIREEVDPCLFVTMPPSFGSFERTMLIGTVRVFALYEV